MKNPSQLASSTLCLAFALLAGGCSTATNALWQREAYHPAQPLAIKLDSDPQSRDILVRYDEQLNKTPHVQERAYWLFDSVFSNTRHEPPAFVADSELASLTNLVNVPVFYSRKVLQQSAGPDYVAFAKPRDSEFELWRNGKKLETYKLPSYFSEHAPVTPWRVALTPGALTADATVSLGKGTGKAMEAAAPYVPVILYYAALGALQFYASAH